VTEPLPRAPFAAKLASAIPDIGTASLFAWCWIDPVALRPELASALGQLMLMEFLVIHSSAFVGALMVSDARPARKAAGGLFLTAVYMSFAAGFTLSHGSWWPFAGFFWLLLSRGATALAGRNAGIAAGRRMIFYWFGGLALYVLGALAARELPLPAGGFAEVYVPWTGWGMSREGVMAWGLLYFGALALLKLLEKPEWYERADDQPITP
jgi:hypothetical protein